VSDGQTPKSAIRETTSGVAIDIRVTPRSSRNQVGELRAERLAIRVTAPPVDDAANVAVVDLLAQAIGVPRGSVRVVSGATSRMKTVQVKGASLGQVRGALLSPLP
jgi:uncharacterized protein (TIGR00251 family)